MNDRDISTPVSVPSIANCLDLMDRYRMLDNIKKHSIMVATVGKTLARSLNKAGHDLSVDLVIAGALLHDIGKTTCLNTDNDHARKGEEICLAHGMNTLAEIVAEHVILSEHSQRQVFTEKVIVYYADKRVNHDKIVSLDKRLEYILKNYGNNDPARHRGIMTNFRHCQAIEKTIFLNLDFQPADLKSRINGPLTETTGKHQ